MQHGIRPSIAARLLSVAMGFVLVGAVCAWLAVGNLHDASAAASARSVLAGTIALADSTAELAAQVQASNDALVTATGSAAEASGWTVTISQNLRGLIEALDGVDGIASKQVDDVRNALGDAEASLLETEGGLDESNAALSDGATALASTVTALQTLRDQLDSVANDLSSASSDADAAVVLSRIAIVLVSLVLLLALAVLQQLVQSPSASSPPAEATAG